MYTKEETRVQSACGAAAGAARIFAYSLRDRFMTYTTCTLGPEEHPELVHVERDIGFVELARVHFEGHNSSNYCGNTGLDALFDGSSVVGFLYFAIEVCRWNECGNTVFEAVSDGSSEKDIVFCVSKGLK